MVDSSYHTKEAVVEAASGRSITYGELSVLSREFSTALSNQIGPQSLVGLLADKCCDGVACLLGIYESENVFVPLPIDSPVARIAGIIADCQLDVIFISEDQLKRKEALMADYIPVGHIGSLRMFKRPDIAARNFDYPLAYILYTSGSTGKPKGVMHGHSQARAFINWALETFEPKETDVFSSIAPFNFDLSVFDLYVSLIARSKLILFDEKVVKNPKYLTELVAHYSISIWYSTPSIFRLMSQHGKLENYDFGHVMKVLFAGEVLFGKDVSIARQYWPNAEFYNLYGPTETNVCTYCKVDDLSSQGDIAIGSLCAGCTGILLNEENEKGELCISGEVVTPGYWNSNLDSNKFIESNGKVFYRTGDLVRREGNQFIYISRLDRMIKRRGNRIELNEIERAIASHSDIFEVAVISTSSNNENRIKAFVVSKEGLNSLQLKAYISTQLPSYMLPDDISFMDALPRTSSQKIDLKTLEEI